MGDAGGHFRHRVQPQQLRHLRPVVDQMLHGRQPAAGFFRITPSRQVADRAAHVRRFVDVERAEADFHRELAAILAQGKQLLSHAHATHLRAREILLAVRRMIAAKALRQQDFDRLPKQLVIVVTEGCSQLCVDQHDLAAADRR